MSGADRKPSGAPSKRDCSYWRERITLCGQTKLQLPHWMHSSESQAATNSEMLRFSYCVVPLGYVPSTGSALTGSSSPRPAIIAAVTVRTNSGACAGTGGSSSRSDVTCSGSSTR